MRLPTGRSGTSMASRPPSSPTTQAGGGKRLRQRLAVERHDGRSGRAAVAQPGVVQHGNYVLRVEGGELPAADLAQLKSKLPKVDRAANPSLPGFLPGRGSCDRTPNGMFWDRFRLRNSSRGFRPTSLASIKGAEAQIARYKTGRAETRSCCCFSYPTPQIAGERCAGIRKASGVEGPGDRAHGRGSSRCQPGGCGEAPRVAFPISRISPGANRFRSMRMSAR